jgi:O-antigen ligase
MGFVISVLYFVTYYLTPATIFGPLAPFRVEMILAILVIVISIPRLPGSIVLKTPQSLALVGLTLAIFLSVLASLLWFGGALSAMLSFVPCAFAYYLACLHCNSIKRLRVLALMLILVCMFVIANGLIESAQGVQESRSQQPDYSGTPYLLAMGNDAGAVILRLRGLGEINDPNDFGQLLVCVIPLVFIFWLPKRSFRNFFLVLLPVGLLLYGTYLTHSRGALLALMAIIIGAARRRIGTMPAVVLGIALFAASMALHFTGGREISTEAGEDRTALWGDGLQILKTHPIFGVGLGGFPDFCGGCGVTAHNSLVVCAAETGSFGLFFWCFFLFPAVRNVMTIASPAKVTEEEPSHSGLDTGLHRSEKRDAMDKAEVNRLGRLLLLSFIGFFVTGWFLSRAFILTLFLLGGMVEVVYELALQRGMVGPRLPIIRTARYSAGLAIALVLVMYAMLRIVNLTH